MTVERVMSKMFRLGDGELRRTLGKVMKKLMQLTHREINDISRDKSSKDMIENVIMQDVTTTGRTSINLSKETPAGPGSHTRIDKKDVLTKALIETEAHPTLALKSTLQKLSPNLRQKTNRPTCHFRN